MLGLFLVKTFVAYSMTVIWFHEGCPWLLRRSSGCDYKMTGYHRFPFGILLTILAQIQFKRTGQWSLTDIQSYVVEASFQR